MSRPPMHVRLVPTASELLPFLALLEPDDRDVTFDLLRLVVVSLLFVDNRSEESNVQRYMYIHGKNTALGKNTNMKIVI